MPRRHSDISPHAPTVKIPRSDLPKSGMEEVDHLPADDVTVDGVNDEGAVDEAALESFIVEVSAGKEATTKTASRRAMRRSSKLAKGIMTLRDGESPESLPEPQYETTSPSSRVDDRTAESTNLVVSSEENPRGRNLKQRKKRSRYLSLNLLGHIAAIIGLSMFTLELPPKAKSLELSSAPLPYESEDSDLDLEIDSESLDELTEGLEVDFQEESLTEETDLASELLSDAAFAELSETSQTSSGEVAGLFGSGMGLEGLGSDGLDREGLASEVALEPMATFFGEKIQGRRIVFLVDNSGGMNGGGLETLIDELLKTVNLLTPRQGFYVIFYSDIAYPMFYPRPARDFIRPTAQNKRQLAAWLDTVELCTGNAVDQGLAAAKATRPDTLFLLTDGRVNTTRDGRKLAAFLDNRGRQFVIHTFGMGTSSTSQASQQLQEIAVANSGRFKRVEITDAMKALARQKARPYHSKQPGTVWGRQVGSGW